MDFGTGRNRTASRRYNPAAGGENMMKKSLSSFNDWYQIEPRLTEYEAFAWEIIEKAGFPTEWESFCKAFDGTPTPPETVKIANSIFYGIEAVKNQIEKNNPEHAALEMMRLCNKGFRLNFSIIEPLFAIGDRHKKAQKKKAQKPRNEALKDMVAKLAKRRDLIGNPWAAKDLWPHLYSMMEEAGLSPEDMTTNQKQTETWKIEYCKDQKSSKRKQLTYGTFQNKLSEARKKISR
jgi:hypothetical protein